MAEFCPICNAPRKPEGLFCNKCGYKYEDMRCPRCNGIISSGAKFCKQCGYRLAELPPVNDNSNSEAQPSNNSGQLVTPQAAYAAQYQRIPAYGPAPSPKKPGGTLKIILIAAAVIIVLAAGIFVSRPLWDKSSETAGTITPTPPIQEEPPSPPVCSYDSQDIIRPALYLSTDYLVYFKGSSEEDTEVMLTVEIPGFTQKYEQKLTLTPQEMALKIRPAMIDGALQTLNTSREGELKVSLQDMSTQKYIIQDSRTITLLSKNDMKWQNDDGSETYYENICAWVTPESPKIKELLRNSIDQLSEWTDGQISAIVGYQKIGDLSEADITYYQVAAMFETMRTYYQVRYNATPITTSGKEAQQRIALPEEVLSQKSGLCIETAVTLASAIEATGMHPMILILPGHAQVAVETWQGSGEYLLVETTALTESNWDNIIAYPTKDQWNQYLADNQVTVVDVELARKDGVKPMQ